MATFQSLPGFREFYPDDLSRRKHIFDLWRRTAHAFGFAEYDAPVLEPLELYKAKSGDEIEAQPAAQIGQMVGEAVAAGAADDIPEEGEAHVKNPLAPAYSRFRSE